MADPLQVALSHIARNWNPVVVSRKTKKPIGREWQKRIITAQTAPRYFNGADINVGVQLGPHSHGLTDVDLDCPEAIALAHSYLPATPAMFGRASKPKSHRLYLSDLCDNEDKAALQFREPKEDGGAGPMLIELRIGGGGKGAQTVFPGSVHEDGEPILWDSDGDPPRVPGDDLVGAVKVIAAASLLARRYPGAGSRHEGALTLGGALARRGWDADAIQSYVRRIAYVAGDAEWRERGTTAAGAVDLFAKGDKVRGLPKARARLGKSRRRKGGRVAGPWRRRT